jgi:hypothetical protein
MTFEMLEERGSIPGVEECIKDGVEEVVLTLLALFSSVRGRRRALNNPEKNKSILCLAFCRRYIGPSCELFVC